jgi:hypothetical protein
MTNPRAFTTVIYEVTERKLWKYLLNLPERAECVLLIGHNPGLHNLALALADSVRAVIVPAAGPTRDAFCQLRGLAWAGSLVLAPSLHRFEDGRARPSHKVD